jgi:hypothetical protein
MNNLTGPERGKVDRLPLYCSLGWDETSKLAQHSHRVYWLLGFVTWYRVSASILWLENWYKGCCLYSVGEKRLTNSYWIWLVVTTYPKLLLRFPVFMVSQSPGHYMEWLGSKDFWSRVNHFVLQLRILGRYDCTLERWSHNICAWSTVKISTSWRILRITRAWDHVCHHVIWFRYPGAIRMVC